MSVVVKDAFYTYLWLREDGTPYYVGKGTQDRGFTGARHNVACPKDPERIIVQAHPTEAEAFAAEQFLIEFYGRKDVGNGSLRNRVEGHNARRKQHNFLARHRRSSTRVR